MTVKAVTGNGSHEFVPLEVDDSVHANHRYQSNHLITRLVRYLIVKMVMYSRFSIRSVVHQS